MQRAMFLIPILLAACAEVPELDQSIIENTRASEYPSLLPLGALRAQTEQAKATSEPEIDNTARLAALRARAARLKQRTVIDPGARAQLRKQEDGET